MVPHEAVRNDSNRTLGFGPPHQLEKKLEIFRAVKQNALIVAAVEGVSDATSWQNPQMTGHKEPPADGSSNPRAMHSHAKKLRLLSERDGKN
jgi:hypothetical protein